MKEKVELPKKGYAVIRCHDGVIVARLQSFPECERALMYRRGSMVSFVPLTDRAKNLRSYLSKIDVMANVGMDGAFYFSGATTAHIDVDIFAGDSHG
ncbi:hypothetical protein OGY87_04775 [Citrobacter sp. Cy234]|uniref:hypothetical protein n=1 Tax=Citrobacter TaxID=544 RepID=UPI002577BC10|nr:MULTISPECIES: hypothetical protein [Citrobacter]MDM2725153.1 hypothetical protein [Citrobacter sp. Cy234]MEB1029083.1 hypothetical protein [Citrobacter youngae]